ncbi:hypothetical protein, partial [Aliarcobacter thereius]|uniref:hypothetical protein n=1 Tax=Aliarcobacter thereius TaxID=544718 RepID=UPI0013F4BEC7
KDNQSIQSSANTSAVFDANLQIITNLRIEKDNPNSEDDLYILKADTINVKNGYEFEIDLNILDYNENSLAIKRDKSKSIDGLIEYKFTLEELKKEFGLETIAYLDGVINEWK